MQTPDMAAMNAVDAKNTRINMAALFSTYGIVFVLMALVAFFSCAADNFFTASTMMNILKQVSVVGIASVGMTMILISGGMDLSIGSTIGLASVSAAMFMKGGMGGITASALAILIATCCGFANGVFVHALRIPPFIATLGMMISIRGLAYLVTGGLPVFGFSDTFAQFSQGYLFGFIPRPVLVMAAVFALGYLFLNRTKYGRHIYGVGCNEEATKLSGVSVRNIKLMVYTIGGALAGLAGVVMLSRVNSGQPKGGDGFEMSIITACVLGGVSISGGEGKIGFVVIGVLIMGVLSTGLIMMGINDYVQQVIRGLVLIGAVALDRMVKHNQQAC